jgi:hypothetical protein
MVVRDVLTLSNESDNEIEKNFDDKAKVTTYNIKTHDDGENEIILKVKDGCLLGMQILTFDSSIGKIVNRHFVIDETSSNIKYFFFIKEYNGNAINGHFFFSNLEFEQTIFDKDNIVTSRINGLINNQKDGGEYIFEITKNNTKLSIVNENLVFDANKIKYQHIDRNINNTMNIIDFIINLCEKYIPTINNINNKKDIGGNHTTANFFDNEQLIAFSFQEYNYFGITFDGFNYQIYKDKDNIYKVYMSSSLDTEQNKFIKVEIDNDLNVLGVSTNENDLYPLRNEYFKHTKKLRDASYNDIKRLPKRNNVIDITDKKAYMITFDELKYNAIAAVKMYETICENLSCSERIKEIINEKNREIERLLNKRKNINIIDALQKLVEINNSYTKDFDYSQYNLPDRKESYQEQQRKKNQHPYLKRKVKH